MALSAQTISRLKSQLQTSGLQQKDQPLFQVISLLIDSLQSIGNDVLGISGGGGSGVTLPQSFLTVNPEPTLPNSEQEIAGAGITILDLPGRRIISTAIPLGGDGGGEAEDGAPGPPGPAGINGAPGPQGANAISFMYAFDAEDGVDGLPGIPGAQGFTGATGATGSPGFPVNIPFDGVDGEDGVGIPGLNGANGANGLNGAMGPPGFDGEDMGGDTIPVLLTILNNPSIPNPIVVAGFDYVAQPWYLWKSVNGNNCLGIGIGNPTVTGGNGFEFHTDSLYDAVITTTTLNAAAGHSGVNAVHCTDFPWTVEFVIFTDTTAVTGVRYWFGVMSGVPAADAITTRHMAIRFSTTAGDAGWIGSIADGTTQQVTGSLGSVAAATRYVLRIRYVISPSKACYFSVNGGAESVLSTNIAATGNMFGIPEGSVTNLVGGAGTARGYALSRMQVYHGSSAR